MALDQNIIALLVAIEVFVSFYSIYIVTCTRETCTSGSREQENPTAHSTSPNRRRNATKTKKSKKKITIHLNVQELELYNTLYYYFRIIPLCQTR